MTYSHGFVIGKFLPLHHGHQHLLAEALKHCQTLSIAVCLDPNDPFTFAERSQWLTARFPRARTYPLPITWNPNDGRAWADGALAALGGQRPDVVFSSEHYGETLAQLWNCAHVMVDRERQRYPVSARQILADPEAYAGLIDPDILAAVRRLEKK